MDRMIYPIVFGSGDNRKVTHIASIDFLRSKSEEDGDFAGIDEPKFDDISEQGYPGIARVTVYRMIGNQKVAFTGVARWKEFYPGEGARGLNWRLKPYLMLAKCAEGQARRLGWPKKLNKLYVVEEVASEDKSDKGNKASSVQSLDKSKEVGQGKPKDNVDLDTGEVLGEQAGDPGPTEPGQESGSAPQKSVKEQLIQAIYNYVDSNEERVPEVLMEISKFEVTKDGKKTGKYMWITPKNLDTVSEARLKYALSNLNARIEKEAKENVDNH